MGLTANSPTHPENVLYLHNNRFSYNDIALYFYGEKGGHVIRGNRFENNQIAVAVTAPSSARSNDWRGNYWDDYQGFDRNGDGFGETPYESYIHADACGWIVPWCGSFAAPPFWRRWISRNALRRFPMPP